MKTLEHCPHCDRINEMPFSVSTCHTCGTQFKTRPMGELMVEHEDELIVAGRPVTYDWGTKFLTPLPDDYAGKVLVLKASALGERWQRAKFQLVRVTGGFGRQPDKLGSKVYGTHLADGEESQFRRNDFIGEATEYLIELASRDTAGPAPLDPSLRVFMAIGQGCWTKADTIKGAKAKLRAMGAKCQVVYKCHPETYIDEMSMCLRWPKAAGAAEIVWESKRK